MEKNRQYRSNQGRSPKQMEGSYKVLFISFVGMVITLFLSCLFS